jgi:processive 1,2-diacylglycerol beta-glucosyltransferase
LKKAESKRKLRMQKKILILSASAGSGHVRAAQAIEEACKKDKRVSEVLHVDTLEYTNAVFQRLYSKGYLEAVKTAPDLWAAAFDALDKPWQKSLVVSAMERLNSQPLVKKIRAYQPDICICTHGMPADIISTLIMQDQVHTNLGIVVTDYYVHALWLTDVFTRYFVAKDESKIHLSLLGLPSDRIVVSGIPVMEAFSAKTAKTALMNKYSFRHNLPVVLLSAGTFGLMPAADIMKILQQIRTPCQIVVICGRNVKLKAELETCISNLSGSAGNLYSIVGFTEEMHEYLKMADLYIGKPGGLSTSECLVCGVPMIIWDPIPGQELYNTYHVLENGAGVMPNNAITIGFKVDRILSDPDRLRHMSACALRLGFPNAAQTIVDAMLAKEDETPVKAFKKKV